MPDVPDRIRRSAARPGRGSQRRDAVAIVAARVTGRIVRSLGHDGTSMPGRVAERVAPGITGRLADTIASVVVVSGTNGKTTTTRLLSHILVHAGRPTVTNRSGANMHQGITSALVAGTGLDGSLHDPGAIAVLEVDEAVVPAVVEALPVSIFLATNLFRDQLDRFGETDEILRRWTGMLPALDPVAVLVACGDDPRLAHLVDQWRGPRLTYGTSAPSASSVDPRVTPDVTRCPRCDGRLAYAWRTIGHLGRFSCEGCAANASDLAVAVRVLDSQGLDGQTVAFLAAGSTDEQAVALRLPGITNAYNAAAAVAAATALGVPLADAVSSLADATSAWGRYEELEIDGRRVVLALGKNPASLSELIRIGAESRISGVLVAVNDGFQDGRDVSWYWDVDPLPLLAGRTWAVTGTGAADFLLRTKYADEPQVEADRIGRHADPVAGLDELVASTSRGDTIFAVATYTAMRSLRASLVHRGLAPAVPR